MSEMPDSETRSGPPRALPVEIWGSTDLGRKRKANEDAIYPHSGADTFAFEPAADRLVQKGRLFVVADGMGGERHGREASHWAIRVAVEHYYDLPGEDLLADLQKTIEDANHSLYRLQKERAGETEVEGGCTMTAAAIHRGQLYLASVGDSRAYLIRAGQIRQLTRDHTAAQRKVEQGLISPSDASTDSQRHMLTRVVGTDPEVEVELYPVESLEAGDTVLLCSDGLTDMLDDKQIARLVGNTPPRLAAQRLIRAANDRGGLDNISAVVARIGGRQPHVVPGSGRRVSLNRVLPSRALLLGILGVVAVLAIAVFFLLGGFSRNGGQSKPSGANPTLRVAITAALATPGEVTATAVLSVPTPWPTDTTEPGKPTSTPRPTFTPEPTPLLPTPIPPTAIPPTQVIPPTAVPTAAPTQPGPTVRPPRDTVPTVPTETPIPTVPTETPIPTVPTETPIPTVPTETPIPTELPKPTKEHPSWPDPTRRP